MENARAMLHQSISPPRQLWIQILLDRCQLLAGCTLDTPQPDLDSCVRCLTSDLPAKLAIRERLALRNVLTPALARTVRASGIQTRPEVVDAFVEWAASDIAAAHWHADVQRFVGRCADSLGRDGGMRPFTHVLRTSE
jgi:hypothetical protein